MRIPVPIAHKIIKMERDLLKNHLYAQLYAHEERVKFGTSVTLTDFSLKGKKNHHNCVINLRISDQVLKYF